MGEPGSEEFLAVEATGQASDAGQASQLWLGPSPLEREEKLGVSPLQSCFERG